IAPKIKFNINKKTKIIEQFDGYFKLKDIVLIKTDENGIPLLPVGLKAKDLEKTRLVKQADVLMLLCLLSDAFSLKTKEANYKFYLPRTIHKSSLSPSIHAVLASEVRDLNKAYNLFNVSLRTDISNLYGNTRDGIHGASLGGTWQAVVFGFAGVMIKREKLFINPRMPRTWKKIVFSLFWRTNLVKLELTNERIKLRIISQDKKSVKIGIFDKLVSLKPNKTYIFEKPSKYKEEYYY
ncbi:MAG TPA: glycoside hydrolase family 65 protein, partial [Candidatus Omnitrophica bacterium]|nr:glycoside hydrolase family 65 protein [Candidatus Omnitrophota bacterium]